MKDNNEIAFERLFKEAAEKCFGHSLTEPLSEGDSKLFSTKIFEATGLMVGVKSIKNYSIYILRAAEAKKENPSIATLDTFARYVLNAPYTDEVKRKDNEGHYPYWFEYRKKTTGLRPLEKSKSRDYKTLRIGIIMALILMTAYFAFQLLYKNQQRTFTENFNSVDEDTLVNRGWMISRKDLSWWNKRNETNGHLSLYTLKGDNWPNSENNAGIKNLLIRKISSECFTTEVHLTEFFPQANWQQAGILLSEDSSFNSRTVRLSILYNNFFGGYDQQPEIIIQGVSSEQGVNNSKPEEIAHVKVFNIDPGKEDLVARNLKYSALKIEKKGRTFRFLYTTSPIETFAFREAVSKDLSIEPKYIGLFAIQGFAEKEEVAPVNFDSFIFENIPCDSN